MYKHIEPTRERGQRRCMCHSWNILESSSLFEQPLHSTWTNESDEQWLIGPLKVVWDRCETYHSLVYWHGHEQGQNWNGHQEVSPVLVSANTQRFFEHRCFRVAKPKPKRLSLSLTAKPQLRQVPVIIWLAEEATVDKIHRKGHGGHELLWHFVPGLRCQGWIFVFESVWSDCVVGDLDEHENPGVRGRFVGAENISLRHLLLSVEPCLYNYV